jgi:hypothetical protein
MARKSTQEIFSIFGVCEAAAAEVLIKDNKAKRIEARDVPISAATNETGQHVLFAVIVPREHLAEFEKLCADMRM